MTEKPPFPTYKYVNKERMEYWLSQWIVESERGDHHESLKEKTPEEAYVDALRRVQAWLQGGYWDWQDTA